MVAETPIEPQDIKLTMMAFSPSEKYMNAVTNMDSSDLTKILYTLYMQNENMRIAIDAVRSMVIEDNERELARMSPANTSYESSRAAEAVRQAVEELGGIIVNPSKFKS